MTVSVTMTQTRLGEDGTLWDAGTTHDASDDFARYLITYNYATGTLPYPLQSLPAMHLTATAAEIAALTGQAGVFYEERDGAKRLWRWVNGAMQQVGAGASSSETHLGTVTAATMLATPSPAAGWTCRVSDLGNTSPWFEYDGTNWRPLGRRQLAFLLAADTAAISVFGSLQAYAGCSCLFPAGVLNFTGAGFEVQFTTDRVAGTEAVTYAALFGSTNTSADAALVSYSAATDRRGVSLEFGVRRESATSLRLVGHGTSGQADSRFAGNTGNARQAAATVDTLAAATYLGLYANSATLASNVNRFQVYVVG